MADPIYDEQPTFDLCGMDDEVKKKMAEIEAERLAKIEAEEKAKQVEMTDITNMTMQVKYKIIEMLINAYMQFNYVNINKLTTQDVEDKLMEDGVNEYMSSEEYNNEYANEAPEEVIGRLKEQKFKDVNLDKVIDIRDKGSKPLILNGNVLLQKLPVMFPRFGLNANNKYELYDRYPDFCFTLTSMIANHDFNINAIYKCNINCDPEDIVITVNVVCDYTDKKKLEIEDVVKGVYDLANNRILNFEPVDGVSYADAACDTVIIGTTTDKFTNTLLTTTLSNYLSVYNILTPTKLTHTVGKTTDVVGYLFTDQDLKLIEGKDVIVIDVVTRTGQTFKVLEDMIKDKVKSIDFMALEDLTETKTYGDVHYELKLHQPLEQIERVQLF